MPLVVDCDNTFGLPGHEIDDGLTLLALLSQQAVEVAAITATYGNGDVDEVVESTRRLLGLVDRNDIPVVRGARGPGDHGTDAASALIRLADRYPGRLVVLAIGSMTNLHAAASADPEFFAKLGGVYAMGGYRGPLRFPRRDVEELNLSLDPAAAWCVLNAPCPVTLMTAQTCLGARYGIRHLLANLAAPRWLRQTVASWFRRFSFGFGSVGFYLWDLVPAVAILDPRWFADNPVRCTSSVTDLSRGRIITAVVADPDPRQAGIVNMPPGIRSSRRFASAAQQLWLQTARG